MKHSHTHRLVDVATPLAAAALAIALFAGPAAAQGALNMTLRSNDPGTACATGDVWGLGPDHVLVARRSRGFAVTDVTDPDNPVTQHVNPPTYPRTDIRSYGVGDIKSDGRFIYASNEDFFQGNRGGFFIYDAAPNPMSPTLVVNFQPTELRGGVHNLWVAGDDLYAVSNTTNRVEIYDITNRAAPAHIGTLDQGVAGSAHDVLVIGDRAYCSMLTGGFAIYDVTNPAAPVLLATQNYTNSFCHNAWPTADGHFLYTTDENSPGGVGGAVRIWDIANLNSISQVGAFKTGATASIVHNVMVVDDLLYISYYKEGVHVCSIKNDPTTPVEIARYDTFPANQTPCFIDPRFAGCWGVYPLNPRIMAVTDLDNGLFLLNMHPVDQTLTALPDPVSAGQTLTVTLDYTNVSATDLDAAGVLVATGIGGIQIFTILDIDAATLAPNQTGTASWNVSVPPGLPPGLVLEVTGVSGLIGATHSIQSNTDVATVTLQ